MAELRVTVTVGGVPVVRQISKRSFVIGSDARADIVVTGDPAVRGEHVRVIVRRTDSAIIVRAIGDGMRVNGILQDIPVTVAPTDRVQIGERTSVTLELAEVAARSGRRWWDPRDWREAKIGPPQIPVPIGNPPMIVPPPGNPPPPEPVPTWNLLTPNLNLDPSTIVPIPGNPPPPVLRDPPRPPRALPPLPAPRWRDESALAADATERGLLAALRAAPDDAAARMVYADWLEAAGREACAAATRGDQANPKALVRETRADWRAIASCPPIGACRASGCPRTWAALAAVAFDERSRGCTTCGERVFYVATAEELQVCAANDAKYAADAELRELDIARLYQLGQSRDGR